MFRRFKYRSKVVFENLVLPEALEFALGLGMSYWQRGGEASGLGELHIAKEIPIPQKRIYSGYGFTPEQFDALTVENQMELWRHLARRTGYRLAAESVDVETEPGVLHTAGEYRLMFGLEHCGFAGERMQLANCGRTDSGLYPADVVTIGGV